MLLLLKWLVIVSVYYCYKLILLAAHEIIVVHSSKYNNRVSILANYSGKKEA